MIDWETEEAKETKETKEAGSNTVKLHGCIVRDRATLRKFFILDFGFLE